MYFVRARSLLRRSASTLQTIDYIVSNKVFDARCDVKIIKSRIKVENERTLADTRKFYREICGDRSFADSALTADVTTIFLAIWITGLQMFFYRFINLIRAKFYSSFVQMNKIVVADNFFLHRVNKPL